MIYRGFFDNSCSLPGQKPSNGISVFSGIFRTILSSSFTIDNWAYGLKPEVWGRVGPDPRAELQVDAARGPQAHGLGQPFLTGQVDFS